VSTAPPSQKELEVEACRKDEQPITLELWSVEVLIERHARLDANACHGSVAERDLAV
jgi:hypothetical protein